MQFVTENSAGYRIPVDSAVSMGWRGKFPNPADYLIKSLGSCAGIVMIMGFSAKGLKLDSFKMETDGTRSKSCDCFFEKLRPVITLSGNVGYHKIAEVIQDTIKHNCPIASMFSKIMRILV